MVNYLPTDVLSSVFSWSVEGLDDGHPSSPAWDDDVSVRGELETRKAALVALFDVMILPALLLLSKWDGLVDTTVVVEDAVTVVIDALDCDPVSSRDIAA